MVEGKSSRCSDVLRGISQGNALGHACKGSEPVLKPALPDDWLHELFDRFFFYCVSGECYIVFMCRTFRCAVAIKAAFTCDL